MNTFSKSVIRFALAMALAAPVAAQNRNGNVDTITIPFSGEGERFVEAHLMHGGITVRGYDGDTVIVEATNGRFHRENKQEEDEKGLRTIRRSLTGLYAEEKDNRVTIGSKNLSGTIQLVIQVPFETSLKLGCMNQGDILVENVSGELDLENLNGKITVTDVSGTVLANALNRDIVATFDAVHPEKPMSFISLNGDIDVTLPADTKATLKMETFSGSIKTGFDIELVGDRRDPVVSDHRNAGGRYRVEIEQAVVGTINGGGPQFVFSSHNGEIRIRKRNTE